MKSLFINNKRVILDNTYFPFTYKISDLEEVNIIGVPQSKTVEIKRLPENDEIFGYIGEIHRSTFNFTEDNLVGSSFNQTKKAYYELFQDSELVSSGQVQVTGVNEENYEITLYDTLIDLLEQFEGNSDTDKGYLSSMDIIKYDNTTFSMQTNALNVHNLNNDSVDVVPVVNITEFETSGSEIRCLDSVTALPIDATLPGEFTPIQARTIKNYEVEYAVPINTVIRSINKYQNTEAGTTDVEYIKVEEGLNTLFDEVHLNCGKPKINEADIVPESFIIDGYVCNPFSSANQVDSINDLKVNGDFYGVKNGKYYFLLDMTIDITNSFNTNTRLSYWNNILYTTSSPYGTQIGEFFIDIYLSGYQNDTEKYYSKKITNVIKLYKDVNITFQSNGSMITGATLNTQIPLEFDWYPEFIVNDYIPKIKIDYTELCSTTTLFSQVVQFYLYPTVNPSLSTFTKTLRTNDTFTGKEILPKVPIKDFIINLCKFYNLDIVNSNNSLLIRRKKYFKTNEVLRIAKLNSVDVNLFNFNKLILTTDVTSNSLIDTYNKNTKQVYGQKGINTGYAIKPNSKKVNIPIGVPALIVDTNKLAYDSFGNYFNAGRSRGMYGVTEGFEDKLVFGYINRITNDPIYITNDTYYEGGMWSSAEPNNYPSEISFKMNNQRLFYNSNSFTFNEDPSPYGQSVRLGNFNTISPYKFDSNGLIIESLEMNKPKYNYAGITDEKYDETVTLYDRYHKKMLEDRYNVDTNIIDVDIYMDSMPNIYAIYNIKGTNYIISELSEYDPSTDGEIFEGIKLLKVNNVYNYGVSDYYNVEITPKLTFDGNIVLLASKLLGYDYNTYGSSQPTSDLFKLLTTNYFNNSLLNITYDNDLDVTYITQTNRTTFEVTPGYINKFKIGNTYFNYLSDYTQQQYLLENNESFQLIDEAGSGVFNQQSLNQPLYLRSGNKIITEASIYDPIKTNLECIQSGGLYYWLISAECILKLNNSTQSLSSISKFKFDNIVIEAKEHPDDIDYTDFQWGHSDLLDVNYTYFSDGSLKFTFKAMLFQGSSFSGTLVDNVRDMWVVPYPDSDYSVKISIDGTYNDYIDAENTDVINFGDVGSNLSYILDNFTGNNETLTTITATNYEVAYNYNK